MTKYREILRLTALALSAHRNIQLRQTKRVGGMTTLEDLYYGNITPHEHSFKRGSEYCIFERRYNDRVTQTATLSKFKMP